MICNKILGKVTKFGQKRTKTLGVANRFMVEGHNVPPLGFIGLIINIVNYFQDIKGLFIQMTKNMTLFYAYAKRLLWNWPNSRLDKNV